MAPEEDRYLGKHLQTCDACRKTIAQIHSAHRYVSDATEKSVSLQRLTPDRVDTLAAANSGSDSAQIPSTDLAYRSAGRSGLAAATAAAVVVCAAVIGNWSDELAPIPQVSLADRPATQAGGIPTTPDFAAVHEYPISFGMVYPANFRENGGYVAGSDIDSIPIDFHSIHEDMLLYYDPAYGMGRSVVDFGFRAEADSLPFHYGLDGPRAGA